MLKILKRLFKKEDINVIWEEYKKVGIELGDDLSYAYMGKPLGFEKLLKRYLILENKLADKKYLPVSLNDFAAIGGWGHDIQLALKESDEESIRDIIHLNHAIVKEFSDIAENPLKYYKIVEKDEE